MERHTSRAALSPPPKRSSHCCLSQCVETAVGCVESDAACMTRSRCCAASCSWRDACLDTSAMMSVDVGGFSAVKLILVPKAEAMLASRLSVSGSFHALAIFETSARDFASARGKRFCSCLLWPGSRSM